MTALRKMPDYWWTEGDSAILAYIEERTEHDLNSGCMLWSRAAQPDGYGIFRTGDRKRSAHREVLRIATGTEPADKQACHSCDTPACCNPAHLWWGTPQENTKDSAKKGRLHFQVNPGAAKAMRQKHDMRGEKSARARLTWDAVGEIRSAHPAMTVKQLAEKFDVSKENIRAILNNLTWKVS